MCAPYLPKSDVQVPDPPARERIMAGKLTAAQGTGILLVTANVGSLFEDVSFSIDKHCLSGLSVYTSGVFILVFFSHIVRSVFTLC